MKPSPTPKVNLPLHYTNDSSPGRSLFLVYNSALECWVG